MARAGSGVVGSPDEYSSLTLRDGTSVLVREIRPEDAPALQRLVERLSERSSYLRYFTPKSHLTDEQARHFAEVDGTDRFALVALDPEDGDEIVAVVRYDRENGDGSAEYAALVEDRFQGRGLGVGMTGRLLEAAREHGIKRLDAYVLHENRAMLHLIRNLGLPEHVYWEDGVERVEIDL